MNKKGKKTAAVFGATSGLGWALASLLLKNGWRTLCFGRRMERLAGFKAGLCGNKHADNIVFCGDIRKKEDVGQALGKCIKRFGAIDCVVVTAGIYNGSNQADNYGRFHEAFDVNFWGYFNVIQELNNLIAASDKTIPVFAISSTLANEANATSVPYSLSKLALEGLARMIRKEIPDTKIKCVTYTAPPFSSEMNSTSTTQATDVARDLYSQIKTEVI